MSSVEQYDHLLKLLLLGDSAVGKSSLLVRFCEDKFDTNFIITIGIDFKVKSIERGGRKLRFQIWDTAGQERFRTITPAYYTRAMGVVIVYDITDKVTFDHVEYWMGQLNEHGTDDVKRILVGNKCDLADSSPEQRKVSREEGEALAKKFNMAFFETSALSGVGVDDAFVDIGDQIVKHKFANAPQPSANGNVKLDGKSQGKKPCAC
jgi:small GTP-binding protein